MLGQQQNKLRLAAHEISSLMKERASLLENGNRMQAEVAKYKDMLDISKYLHINCN